MKVKKKVLLLSAILVASLAALPIVLRSKQPPFLAEADLGDGRILRIERVTHGKQHRVGRESVVIKMLGPWLPDSVREFFAPAEPRNEISGDEDRLVIWVNAIDAVTKTNVDCQSVRLDLIGAGEAVFSEEQSHWFGGQKFWRVGHAFAAFPRNSETLTLRITRWRGTNSVEVYLPNPARTEGVQWTGRSLPQTQTVGAAEIVLTKLEIATNETTYWKAGSAYWKPEFEVRWNGAKSVF